MSLELDPEFLRGLKSIAAIARSVPGLDKVDSLTLQCHLLLEEELDRLLRLLAKNAEYLQLESDKPPGFALKMNMVRAFGPSGADKRWAVMEKFNTVRNKIAHLNNPNARTKGLKNLENAFQHSYPAESKKSFEALKKADFRKMDKENAIILGSYLLSGFFLHEISQQIMGNDQALIAKDAEGFAKKCEGWFNQLSRSGIADPRPPDPPLTGYEKDSAEPTTRKDGV